jgi:hypothetical protein
VSSQNGKSAERGHFKIIFVQSRLGEWQKQA